MPKVIQVVEELGKRPLQQVGVVAQEPLDDRRVRLGVLLAVAVASTKWGDERGTTTTAVAESASAPLERREEPERLCVQRRQLLQDRQTRRHALPSSKRLREHRERVGKVVVHQRVLCDV